MNREYIEAIILRLCKQPRSFEFISQNLSGLDPVQIMELLDNMICEQKLQKKHDLWSKHEGSSSLILNFELNDPQLYLKKYMGYFDFLKTPHPLDFEWRNTTASLHFLLNEIQASNQINDRILLLGMPTLFATACSKDIPQRITLVENNTPIVNSLRKLHTDTTRFQVFEADIFNVTPQKIGHYDFVMMDPPWYSPHFYQFMWLASQCVKIGGTVGISLPPINTRPNISSERVEWFHYCDQQGLCLENLSAQKLQYAMPFFEFNAFRAAGVTDIQPFWRKGDLALFKKVKSINNERPKHDLVKNNWIEKEIETVRFRIKSEPKQSSEKLEIASIVKGDILPTVSARDDRRIKANLWTSGNRIFQVSNPNIFFKILQGFEDKSSRIEDSLLVKDFVKTISGLEKSEYNNYLSWLYREMENN